MSSKKISLISIIAVSVLLAACQQPANIKQMQMENDRLAQQLAETQSEVVALKNNEQLLQSDIDELNRVAAVLGTEKSSRAAESSELRGQVRKFVQQHIDALKKFLQEGNLLDYVGSELVVRANTNAVASIEKPAPQLLVDFANPVPKAGTLTGVAGVATAPTDIFVKVLRQVDQSWVVIWSSPQLEFTKTGLNRANFPVGVGVEKGDIIAYYFPVAATISFDMGTGDVRASDEGIKIGGLLKESKLAGKNKRYSYSLGVFGLLN